MAEAAVEERGPVVPRFYCHKCDREINIPNSDFVCPICAGGFVEQLPERAATTPGTSSGPSNINNGNRGQRNAGGNRFAGLDALRGEITTLLMSRNGPNVEISIDPGNRPAGGRVRPQNLDRLDNVLIDFLHSISGGDVEMPFGNSSMVYLGNVGDYAWGREGIDTIVTQLLNQMETSGPPPMSKDKIAEIPRVEVTENEIDRKVQCSVCWEDFKLKEMVRKLACTHIFHENCIVPWLELHCTCPICRKSLVDEAEQSASNASRRTSGATSSNPNTFANSMPTANPPQSQRFTMRSGNASNNAANLNYGNTRRNSGPTSQTNNQSNNVFTFDDSNIDLD